MFRVKGENKKLAEQTATAANSLSGDADLCFYRAPASIERQVCRGSDLAAIRGVTVATGVLALELIAKALAGLGAIGANFYCYFCLKSRRRETVTSGLNVGKNRH